MIKWAIIIITNNLSERKKEKKKTITSHYYIYSCLCNFILTQTKFNWSFTNIQRKVSIQKFVPVNIKIKYDT